MTPGSTSMLWAAVLTDLDEGDEEVVDAFAQLLHVGVLIGGAFVAVDGDALSDVVAVEIAALAQRLHDELLQVAAEEQEAVFVGENDHVFLTLAAGCVVPHEGQQGGGVVAQAFASGDLVAGGRAGEEAVDIEPLEGGREESDGGGDAGSAADPIPHGEAIEPLLFLGELVELGAGAGDGHGMLGEVEAGGLEGRLGGEHAVAGFRCAA